MAETTGTLEGMVKPNNNRLVENLILSTIIQFFRLGLPLLVIPLLTRNLSPEKFGLYIYTVSLSMWVATIIDYGFGISGPREFPKLVTDNDRKEMIVKIQSAKVLIVAALTLTGFITYISTTFLTGHETLVITALLLATLMSLQPNYYFQAQERLRFIGIIEIITSIFTLVLLYGLIQSDEDYKYLPIALLIPRMLALTAIIYQQNKEIQIHVNSLFNLRLGIKALKDGRNIFQFQFLVSLYTTFNVVALGIWVPATEVAPYAVAERLVRAGLSIISQINQVFFWRQNNLLMSTSREKNHTIVQAFYITTFLGGLGVIITYFIGDYIGYVLFGQYSKDFSNITKIMAFTIPAIVLSGTFSFQFLITNKKEAVINRIIFIAAIVNIFLAYFLVQRFGNVGLSVTWLIIEWSITIILFLYIWKQRHRKVGQKQ